MILINQIYLYTLALEFKETIVRLETYFKNQRYLARVTYTIAATTLKILDIAKQHFIFASDFIF